MDLSPAQPTAVSSHQWTQQSAYFCSAWLEPTVSVGSLSVGMSRVRSEQCHLNTPLWMQCHTVQLKKRSAYSAVYGLRTDAVSMPLYQSLQFTLKNGASLSAALSSQKLPFSQ